MKLSVGVVLTSLRYTCTCGHSRSAYRASTLRTLCCRHFHTHVTTFWRAHPISYLLGTVLTQYELLTSIAWRTKTRSSRPRSPISKPKSEGDARKNSTRKHYTIALLPRRTTADLLDGRHMGIDEDVVGLVTCQIANSCLTGRSTPALMQQRTVVVTMGIPL